MASTLFQSSALLRNANIYEVNIRQYTPEGTFKAFSEHLPRLKKMGVGILWFMPIHPIGREKRKGTLGSYYSIQDHKAVNQEFGTAEDLATLIAKIHALDMKIILDWIANHASWDNVWTKTNPDFFERDEAGNFKPPYDWDDVIQIDHSNKAEQIAMIDAMQYWVTDFNIDGFRADLAHLTPLQFWKDARLKISAFKKELIWLAETEDISYHEAFDISYTWEWMHATEKLKKKEISLRECVELLKKHQKDFPKTTLRMFFTSNHDENSWNGTEYEKYGSLAKALAVFSFTYPSVPLIYSGQELPNMKRLKFFDKDEIEWKEAVGLDEFYSTLLSLRTKNKAVATNGTVEFIDEEIDNSILAYQLTNEDDTVLVFLNLSAENVQQQIKINAPGKYRDVFTNEIIELNDAIEFAGEAGTYKILAKFSPADHTDTRT